MRVVFVEHGGRSAKSESSIALCPAPSLLRQELYQGVGMTSMLIGSKRRPALVKRAT
jgi:hypothetical protein